MRSSLRLAVFCTALALALTSICSAQGPLTPPGTPAPIMKSLDEIYTAAEASGPIGIPINQETVPGGAVATFLITEPGSYYLTENLTGEENKDGISVTADDVTIDLHGFTLTGVPNSKIAINAASSSNFRVSNGTVRTWPEGGVVGYIHTRIDGLLVYDCGGAGISTSGSAIMRNCRVVSSASTAYYAGDLAYLENCTAASGDGAGFAFGGGCVIRNCTAINNGGVGFAQGSGGGSILENCVSNLNNPDGFSLCAGNIVRNCVAYKNTTGIYLRCGKNMVTENLIRNNDTGITASTNGSEVVYGNTLVGNTTAFSGTTGNYFGPAQLPTTATSPTANFVIP
ncbi:right-handed parallel beta-helix repeat-containing protein [bacterium]|nr:right-handed parallel beta-helix repeat-containing protein [bacterium]